MSRTYGGAASTHVVLAPSGVAHLFGVLQRAAASHHAFADRNETKPETERGAADAQGGLGRTHCQGAATGVFLCLMKLKYIY